MQQSVDRLILQFGMPTDDQIRVSGADPARVAAMVRGMAERVNDPDAAVAFLILATNAGAVEVINSPAPDPDAIAELSATFARHLTANVLHNRNHLNAADGG